jgi:hypothetical protein
MRALIVAALAELALLGLAPAASAAGGWLEECNVWHGEQYCREQYTQTHIPTRGELREEGRDCRTGWADRRRDCGSQA